MTLAPFSDPETVPILKEAWTNLGLPGALTGVRDISANVSTNRVFTVRIEDGREYIAKTSSYGSYVYFRQDHRLIHEWRRQLKGTRYRQFLAPIVEKDGEVFTYRKGAEWAVFYEKAPFYDFLPKVLTPDLVTALGREMAEFHRASTHLTTPLPPSWKSVGSDVALLHDALGRPEGRRSLGVDDAAESLLRSQCDTFLTNAERLGYHHFQKIPVLVDWNIGNFSVGFDQEGFRFFSRWDYDWFRVEPRMLDFYFCARVVRSEGDQTVFHYTVDPFFDAPFQRFLRAYHGTYPLEDEEILFLKEAYRFFLLNYVIRSGEHFFQEGYAPRLKREAIEVYFPALDEKSFMPLVRALSE